MGKGEKEKEVLIIQVNSIECRKRFDETHKGGEGVGRWRVNV